MQNYHIDFSQFAARDTDVADAMQNFLEREVCTLSKGQVDRSVVLDFGVAREYKLDHELLLQQKHLKLLAPHCFFRCHGDHGIVIDYDDAASNPSHCHITGLTITGAKSHGIHAKMANYLKLRDVECSDNGGDGTLVEGAVQPKTENYNSFRNGGWGYREKTLVKVYNRRSGRPITSSPVLVRKSKHTDMNAAFNGVGGIASWESHNATFDTPTVQVNGGNQQTNTEGVGIQLHSTLKAELRTPYTEVHSTDIQIIDSHHEYGLDLNSRYSDGKDRVISGENVIIGGLLGGAFIRRRRPVSIEIDSFGTSLDHTRVGGHITVSRDSRGTVLGSATKLRGQVINSSPDIKDLR